MAQNIALSVRTDFERCFIPTTCIGFVEYDPRGVLNGSVGDRTDVMTLPSLFSPLENSAKKWTVMALQLLLSLIIRSVVPSYILSFKYLFLSQLHIMVENNKVFFLTSCMFLERTFLTVTNIYLSILYNQAQDALLILLTRKCQKFSDMQISYRIIKSNQNSHSKKYELSKQ